MLLSEFIAAARALQDTHGDGELDVGQVRLTNGTDDDGNTTWTLHQLDVEDE